MKKIITRLMGTYLNLLALVAPRLAGRKGFLLFCTPQRVPVKSHHRKFLGANQNFSFEHDGIAIQGYRWGNGRKKILFLHGWQSHSFRWKNYIESLSTEEFTLYAFDAPGHGLTAGKYLNLPIYSAVIEKFMIQHPGIDTLVSHSLGSFAALYTLHRIPTLPVNQLVITGTPGEVGDYVEFYRQTLGLGQRTLREIRKSFVEIIGHLPEYYSAEKFAASVSIPGLIIHDEHDKETPYRYAVDIHSAWKNSRLITTSGLGHNLRSREVIKAVVDFAHAGPSLERNTECNFEVARG